MGLASVGDEVLNRIVSDSQLGGAPAAAVDLAVLQLPATQHDDLFLHDRGYASYRWKVYGVQHQRHFVGRGSAGAFRPVRQRLKGLGADNQVVNLTPSFSQRVAMLAVGLPSSCRARVERVVLPNGDFAVLVTNLWNETSLPTSSFSQLYHLRWGVETFSGVVTTRLQLENFSGLTAAAVRPEVSVTIFITNLDSVLVFRGNRPVREEDF